MVLSLFNRILGLVITLLQKLWRAKNFLIRAAFCWFIGFAVLLSERSDDFDIRFRIRGDTLKSNDITLILISEDEWTDFKDPYSQHPAGLNEAENFSDNYFADTELWGQFLGSILKLKPKSVGITFFFSEPWSYISAIPNRIFSDPRIFWGARLDSDGYFLKTKAWQIPLQKQGLIDLNSDSDGYLRRFSATYFPLPALPVRLAKGQRASIPSRDHMLINYQGPTLSFPTYSLTDLMKSRIPNEAIAGKIIIIGARDVPSHTFLTPVGLMPRAEVLANITNNILYDQWIKMLPFWSQALLLVIFVILSIWITTEYSQGVALIFLSCIWLLLVSLSTWVFDVFHYWVPVLAPTVQLISTFVIFLSYQLMQNEKRNWELQQEKLYLEEIEEIKNNFLSLISHDLKTPIAKIQAVADRLLETNHDELLKNDLKTVKSSSQDLHRYIQSLLQVIRVESTDFQARKTPTDINEIIHQVVENLMPLARDKKIEIDQKLEPLFSMELDSALIYEVLLNLIENAIKYTPSGKSITVTSKEIQDSVEVRVIDTGEGIPAEEIPRVWNKFYRGKRHDMSTKGSGLGLYLAKYFITLHGGEVFLTSECEVGTEVGFRLPLNEPETEGVS